MKMPKNVKFTRLDRKVELLFSFCLKGLLALFIVVAASFIYFSWSSILLFVSDISGNIYGYASTHREDLFFVGWLFLGVFLFSVAINILLYLFITLQMGGWLHRILSRTAKFFLAIPVLVFGLSVVFLFRDIMGLEDFDVPTPILCVIFSISLLPSSYGLLSTHASVAMKAHGEAITGALALGTNRTFAHASMILTDRDVQNSVTSVTVVGVMRIIAEIGLFQTMDTNSSDINMKTYLTKTFFSLGPQNLKSVFVIVIIIGVVSLILSRASEPS